MNLEKIRAFLQELGIKQEGIEQANKYTIDLENSNAYSRVYTILDKSPLTDLDVENITMNVDGTSMVYLSDNYDITLSSNFGDNSYTLTIEEAND